MRRFHWLIWPVAWTTIAASLSCTRGREPSQTVQTRPGSRSVGENVFPQSSLTPEHAAEAKELQGMWKVSSFQRDGKSTPVQEGSVIPYTFEGNTLITVGPLNAKVEIEYRLDPTKKPKQFDQRFTGGNIGPWIAKGIYRLEGGNLTICYGGPNVARPTEFSTDPGDGRSMRVHTRIK
jgi:uncharacterized protein (TIGR03067 family)